MFIAQIKAPSSIIPYPVVGLVLPAPCRAHWSPVCQRLMEGHYLEPQPRFTRRENQSLERHTDALKPVKLSKHLPVITSGVGGEEEARSAA